MHAIIGVRVLAFSPDGRLLAAGEQSNTVKVWNVATGTLLHTLSGHLDTVNSLVFSPDGHVLAYGSEDDTARLWDVASGTLLHILKGHTDGVNALPYARGKVNQNVDPAPFSLSMPT